MARDNERFGISPGSYRVIEPVKVPPIKLFSTGINVMDGPKDIGETEAVDMADVRTDKGGVGPERELVLFGDAIDASPILHVSSFDTPSGQRIGLRMKAGSWERYNGRDWVTIPGTISGIPYMRLYTTVFKGLFIAANGRDRMLKWDGNPAHEVEPLSDEAPRARFVIRIGNRLLAAGIKLSSIADWSADEVAYSADDDIEEWTDVLEGAGSLIASPEGRSEGENGITGLSAMAQGAVLYRERALVMISRTGVRAAPFRFQTIDTAHGTKSPYSIANGGLAIGDFFLGFDHVVYHFDGQSPPVPIGLPIQPLLEQRITDLDDCVGFINPDRMEYCLMVPTQENNKPVLDEMYIFSIRDYLRKKKLNWRYRSLSVPGIADLITTGGYPIKIPTNYVTVVDEYDDPLLDIVDDQDWIVDSLVQQVASLGMFGTDLGNTYQVDENRMLLEGFWLSKQFGQEHDDFTIDRIRLVASATMLSYVGVSVTWDGGVTFTDEVEVRIEPSNRSAFSGSGWRVSTGRLFQFRLRPLHGDAIVHEINVYGQSRGRSA
jgi:hypothetical protein